METMTLTPAPKVRATRHAALAYREATGLWPHQATGLRRVYKGRGVNRNHLTGLYQGAEAGLDTSDGLQPWSTVCERHHFVCSHETRELAESMLAHPADEGWCEVCAGTYDPEAETA